MGLRDRLALPVLPGRWVLRGLRDRPALTALMAWTAPMDRMAKLVLLDPKVIPVRLVPLVLPVLLARLALTDIPLKPTLS